MQLNPKRKKVTFTFMYVPGKQVFVAGSFNKWDPKALQLVDHDLSGGYTVTILLPKGRHEYKFFADANWQVDPFNSESVVNEYGSLNSVIVV
jgi:1,4-alpha-glucan branching enzyme